MSALRARFSAEGDTYVVSLVRALLGVLLGISAVRAASELLTTRYFGEVFHLPLVPEMLVPSRSLYTALVAAQLALAALVVVGIWARTALLGSAAIGLHLLACDRLGYHNNRYALLLFALILAFAPCDRYLSLGRASTRGPTRAGLWAQRLARAQLSVIYLASGGAKLLDDDWRGGLVLADRLRRGAAMARAAGVPGWFVEALSEPVVASALAKAAIGTELFLAVALHLPRVRAFALWWGLMFHLTIELTSKVELFGWLMVSVYALFATPELRERAFAFDPERRRHRQCASALRGLDWLRRFELCPSVGVRALTVTGRDGRGSTGLAALAEVARAVPLLFPFSMPLLASAFLFGSRGPEPTTEGSSRANAGEP